MLKKETITVGEQKFEVSFDFLEVESGTNHIVAKTILNGESIAADDNGLGKNSALSKLRRTLRERVLKKAA